jgi:branched-chain amino acid transport system ATP-binding protein
MAAILDVEGLSVEFGGLAAVKDVSFEASAGAVTSVIGPNGAGKTTLFNMISGFQRPSRGRVRFAGQDVTAQRPWRIAQRGLVRTFQKTEVFPELSVFDCVRVGLLNGYQPSLLAVLVGSATAARFAAAAPETVQSILDLVGLRHRADAMARELSYGEQRLLEIAVGLAARPQLLMLDEPASGLNAEEAERLATLIRAMQARGIAVLLVEHNMNLVMTVSDLIVVLHHGEKIAQGTPDAVSRDRSVVAAYLGREWGTDAVA